MTTRTADDAIEFPGARRKPADAAAPLRVAGRLRHTAGPAALALGPAMTVVGFAFHPRADKSLAFVSWVSAHAAQWAIAHLLIGLGLTSLAAGVGSTLRLARGVSGWFILAGAMAVAVGAIGMGYDAISHGAIGYALASHPDVPLAVSAHVQAGYESLPAVAWTGLASMLFPLGTLLLAIGALVSRRVPAWGAVLLLLGPVGISFAGSGPLELLGAAPLVIGFATVARAAIAATQA